MRILLIKHLHLCDRDWTEAGYLTVEKTKKVRKGCFQCVTLNFSRMPFSFKGFVNCSGNLLSIKGNNEQGPPFTKTKKQRFEDFSVCFKNSLMKMDIIANEIFN